MVQSMSRKGDCWDNAVAESFFATLEFELHTIVRNTCRTPTGGQDAPTFDLTTTPTPQQQRALALIETITL